MKKVKKILCILLFIVAIFQIALQMNSSRATEIGDVAYLERGEKGFYSIQKWNGSNWTYVTYSITYYTDSDGVKRVAYCVDPSLNGVGWISGEYEGYNAKLTELISDERLWRVYTNGYPYKTPSDMGVETEEDAYLATKMAAYAILKSYTLDEIKTLYRAGEDAVEGQSLEDIQRRGSKVVDAIYNLVNIGYNGTETMQYNNILSISQQNELEKDSKNENYYSITCKVNSKVECSNYTVTSISNFPEGTYIANTNGKEQSNFSEGEMFKIMVPKESILESVTGTVNITGTCKNYPIYYAECEIGDYQNYMLCCDSYSENVQASTNISINANKCNLQIVKIDKDTENPIQGVKFSVMYEDGTNLGEYETDENGVIEINNLKPGNIQITEVETNENYVLDSSTNTLGLVYDETTTITLQNEKKKGSIKIIKVDANDNTVRIPGVTFEIYNENGDLIATLITDENGEVQIDDLPIDVAYTIKETQTNEEYILSDDEVTIELEENEIKTLTFKNEKKAQETETLPRTGETDITNYLIGISAAGIIINKRLLKKKEENNE